MNLFFFWGGGQQLERSSRVKSTQKTWVQFLVPIWWLQFQGIPHPLLFWHTQYTGIHVAKHPKMFLKKSQKVKWERDPAVEDLPAVCEARKGRRNPVVELPGHRGPGVCEVLLSFPCV